MIFIKNQALYFCERSVEVTINSDPRCLIDTLPAMKCHETIDSVTIVDTIQMPKHLCPQKFSECRVLLRLLPFIYYTNLDQRGEERDIKIGEIIT